MSLGRGRGVRAQAASWGGGDARLQGPKGEQGRGLLGGSGESSLEENSGSQAGRGFVHWKNTPTHQ